MVYTLREIVNKSADYLNSAGLPSPRLEAELLVSHAAGLDRLQLYVQYDKPLTQPELASIRSLLLERVKKRVPVTYLTGSKYFLGMELKVPRGVFIPRPETEELVEAVVKELDRRSAYGPPGDPAVLDLCTGTGAVGLALARKFTGATVIGVDISSAAVETALSNAFRLGLGDRFSAVRGDLWSAVPDGTFDLIVSNPPYIPHSEIEDLAPEIRHEPWEALNGGEDGLDIYRRIFQGLRERLCPYGFVALEHGPGQGEALVSMAERAGLTSCRDLNDLTGRPRIFLAGVEGEPLG